MPLSWNEIRDRAVAFSREWADESRERAEAQTFWNEFFQVFGVPRRRVATFEEPVKKLGAKRGSIDAFWKGMLVVEHKSRGEDLDRAFTQAIDYFPGIADRDLPKYVLVSDFARLRLYDLDAHTEHEFPLRDLHTRIKRFGFIAGYAPQEIKPQDPVNIHAAEQMGRLHDQLKAAGYLGHPLEVFLVRLVFCLFADDTGIFPKQSFRDWLDARTAEDGSDFGPKLAELFQVLNTHRDKRQKNLDEQTDAFDYINGRLFEEALPLAQFDAKMRATLLDCCALNWGSVSPAIFGALFQAVMDEKARRNLGAHYTSEENILKLIKPLFLDELWVEFEKVKRNKNRLFEFHKKLRSLNFLDPACGCGNFLVITYRELRMLELAILRASLTLETRTGQRLVDIQQLVSVDVDQFYGIEIEEFPAQIAQVALWLIDHQMNVRVSEEFGMYFARIPLVTSPHIVNGNALKLDWASVVPPERLSYILGNPPFVGKKEQGASQKSEITAVAAGIKGAGVLDYVAAWYIKAARFIKGTQIECAFVSTNSITQGEQVGVLWPALLALGIRINFAHRTFQWSNEARGVAAVHCVIIGFASLDRPAKVLYEYDSPKGDPHAITVGNINPYLVDAADVIVERRTRPIGAVPEISYGSMALDDGHLLLSREERTALINAHPETAACLRQFMGGEEFLNRGERWCLWLVGVSPTDIRRWPLVRDRVDAVRRYRESSGRETTQKLAAFPTLFGENRQPDGPYLLVPKVSSENRPFMPIGIFGPEVVASGSALIIPGGSLYHLGVLSSTMHMAWMRYTGGRLESRYQYSSQIVYNNFPWPEKLSDKQVKAIDTTAQAVLDARTQFPNASLADLYDPDTMPPALVKAHQTLDRAVDAAYGKKSFASDAERVAFLFDLYLRYTSLPLEVKSMERKRKRAKQN